ncbi:MAG: hypothetical protein NVV74_12815 [Magnetospirillum sp.]|nr:hypothetical protein [Magnetospirillum sp.]
MSGWGCVHEVKGVCSRVADRPCDPGMKGCVLAGRFRFSNEAKNRPPRRASTAEVDGGTVPSTESDPTG